MNLTKWLRSQPKQTWIIAVVAAILLLLLIMSQCNSKKIQQQNINNAVSQHEIENLQAENEQLKQQRNGSEAVSDSLLKRIKERDSKIVQLQGKVAVIALKYQSELNRLDKLSNDESVAEFLDQSDCGEIPVVKYDSLYLIPIEPIRQYNNIRAGFDMQVDVNKILVLRINEHVIKETLMDKVIGEKDYQLTLCDSINSNHTAIEVEKDKQIKGWQKKYKAEKRNKWIVGVAGVAVLVGVVLIK